MTRARDFDLAAALAKPGFTAGQRDAPALVELVIAGEEPASARAAQGLAGLADAGRRAIAGRLAGGNAPADTAELGEAPVARLVGALGLLARAGDGEARATLLARLHDPAVRVRRAAISAIGKLEASEDLRTALVARFDAGDAPPDERRTLVEALGKLGGDDAMARLRAIAPGDDAELARRRDRALLMADRDARRDAESTIATDVAFDRPLRVRLHCRAGFAELLRAELDALHVTAQAVNDSALDLTASTPWSALFASRLWTTAGIRMPLAGDSPAQITRAIVDSAAPILRAWTRGPIRWRLGFASGHRRAVVWQVARDVTAAASDLINDPTATTWDILVDDGALELVPRRADDPRFAWRVADVPASSHPTVAAALVWLAGWRDGERVWDPFCGAALELVERGLRGRCTLIGSDVDAEALAAARANVAAAKIDATLATGDARDFDPGRVDAIVTNPPLGSRVQLDAAQLLADALPNFARRLAPSGRLVWITPAPKRTGPAAERAGLRRAFDARVDLGGVRGVLERWEVIR